MMMPDLTYPLDPENDQIPLKCFIDYNDAVSGPSSSFVNHCHFILNQNTFQGKESVNVHHQLASAYDSTNDSYAPQATGLFAMGKANEGFLNSFEPIFCNESRSMSYHFENIQDSSNYSSNPQERSLFTTVNAQKDDTCYEDTKTDYLATGSIMAATQTSTEGETPNVITKRKNDQSKYKNKDKELIEQTTAFFKDFLSLDQPMYQQIFEESNRTAEEWEREGYNLAREVNIYEKNEEVIAEEKSVIENLSGQLKRETFLSREVKKLETSIATLSKKTSQDQKSKKKLEGQLKKMKQKHLDLMSESTDLSLRLPSIKAQLKLLQGKQKQLSNDLGGPKLALKNALETKRFAYFLPMCQTVEEIKKHLTKEDCLNYFKNYKTKKSMQYFEKQMEEKELLHWLIILKSVLLFVPQEDKFLKLLPLKKETAPFMYWMIKTPMNLQHKTEFRLPEIRAHLRTEFTRVFNKLHLKAKEGALNPEKLGLISNFLNSQEDVLDFEIEFDININIDIDISVMQEMYEEHDSTKHNGEKPSGKRLRQDYISSDCEEDDDDC